MMDKHAPAVLLDVDGTLVDSNYVHVMAWLRAFCEAGVPVEAWRIHRGIGMDGSTLVRDLSGDAPLEVQQQLRELHSRYYRESASLIRPLPGACALLRRLARLGLQVVLATSAPQDELAVARQVLDCEDAVSAVTLAGDVDTAKPEPGIVQVALDRVGVTAQQAVFVGDAVWDAKACARAGVTCVGVLSGGVGRDELHLAGMAEVFEGPDDLLVRLHDSAIAALLH